jgi:hypothetical protein
MGESARVSPERQDGCPIQACLWLAWMSADQAPRYSLLQRLQSIGQGIFFRFAEQEVNMLRHNYVAIDMKSETAPYPF